MTMKNAFTMLKKSQPIKMGTWRWNLLNFVLAAVFLTANASAQTTDYHGNIGAVTLSTGQTGNNFGNINRTTVNGGTINNRWEGTIGILNLNSGTANNTGIITIANADGGRLTNNNDGIIRSLWVRNDASVTNSSGGKIDYVSIWGGSFSNRLVPQPQNPYNGVSV